MSMTPDVVGQNEDQTKLRIRRIVAYVVLVILVFISLFPFYLLIINATRGKVQNGLQFFPSGNLVNNIKNLFGESSEKLYGNIWSSFGYSFVISSLSCACSVYFSALTAYAIHVYNFKLKNAVFTFILLIMMVPTQSSAIGFYRMMIKWKLTDSLIPLIVPAIAAPAVFFFMKQYMDSALPLEIVEASRMDGCGEFRTFNTIVLPILKPAFAVQGIFSFVSAWNNYFMPRMILQNKKTIPLVLQTMKANIQGNPQVAHQGIMYTYMVLAILPVVIVYLALSKFIIRGIALGSVKG